MALRNAVTVQQARALRQRKIQFRQALVAADLSMAAWARREGVTPGHLSQVVDGNRPGFGLDAKIDQFIAKYLTKVA